MYYKIILNIKLHIEIVNKYLGVKWIDKNVNNSNTNFQR